MAYSFDDQRIQASQSNALSYSFALWAQGYNPDFTASFTNQGFGGTAHVYAPINVLSSGSRFSTSSFLTYTNLSLNSWNDYDGDLNIGLDTTGTLYMHASFSGLVSGGYAFGWYPSSMLIVDVGTTSSYLSLNISGSIPYPDMLYAGVKIYYGKPWSTDGSGGTGSSTFITGFFVDYGVNMNFTYDYTYNSSSGSYLYFILLNGCVAC